MGIKLRVRHLLGMTSGLPRQMDDLNEKNEISIEVLVDHLKKQVAKNHLSFEPGAKFEYSNINYQILTYIIEQKSGKTYAGYMEDNIFGPLGMTQTRVEPLQRSGNTHMSLSLGAGSVLSSVDDMWRWQQHLEKLGQGVHGRISPQSFDAMTTSGKGEYGLGLFVGPNGYYHGGETPDRATPDGIILGGRSYFRHQEGTTIIVLSKNVREEVEFIAKVVEFKMKGESMPPDLQLELDLMKLRLLIRQNQISDAIEIFYSVQSSMEHNETKAEFLGKVGTFYNNVYVKNRPDQVIDQNELCIMIQALEKSLSLIEALPKPLEYKTHIVTALEELKSVAR